jgi:protein-S-isoprenylcysteine O-methyltransferase Ste14
MCIIDVRWCTLDFVNVSFRHAHHLSRHLARFILNRVHCYVPQAGFGAGSGSWHRVDAAFLAPLRIRAVGTSWSAAPGREWRWRWVMAGTSTALLGWGLRKWAKQTLAGAFTYIISNPKELVTTGPYQWWVHPGYAGVIAHVTGLVMLAAVSCSHPFAITVCSVAFAVALVLLRIQDEETMLAATHHAQWAAHIETRWRLMPFVW